MKRLLLFCLLILSFSDSLFAQLPENIKLKNGDLIFQDLDCGPLCDAIERVTISYGNRHFSHLGMVYVKSDSTFLLEAIGTSVQLTPLPLFSARTTHPMLVGRVKLQYENIVKKAVDYGIKQIGTPYDDEFLYANGKYYCSELIYDAFKTANGGKDFFVLQPMTFKQPEKNDFFPVWIGYYEKLGIAIPESQPGINPGGISTSPLIDILNP